MCDNCQITVKAVNQSLDNHYSCQGVIGKDNGDNLSTVSYMNCRYSSANRFT